MKTILTLAAAAAALAIASVASANDTAGGHYEWRDAPAFGPKAIPHRNHVWVNDAQTSMASCNCSMMKADASGCMMSMPGKSRAPSAG
ncbi:MAG: hypothetical protein ABIM50_08280 [Novosphingobium sp.]